MKIYDRQATLMPTASPTSGRRWLPPSCKWWHRRHPTLGRRRADVGLLSGHLCKLKLIFQYFLIFQNDQHFCICHTVILYLHAYSLCIDKTFVVAMLSLSSIKVFQIHKKCLKIMLFLITMSFYVFYYSHDLCKNLSSTSWHRVIGTVSTK